MTNGKEQEKWLEQVADLKAAIVGQLERQIVGHSDVIEQVLTCVLSGGHVLLVGVPGLAKTLLVKTLASTLTLQFGRIQFTPDLMPTDVTGTDILEDAQSGHRNFRFVKGPIFCNILLADELNRTPPKTQAALLQAMQEKTVTTGGNTYELPAPFLTLATQNPIEQAGTYPLPEAQLDRFMMEVRVEYPSAAEEFEIVKTTTVGKDVAIETVISQEQLLELQRMIPRVPCADHVVDTAVKLVRSTRPDAGSIPMVRDNVTWGAGPRAAQMLVLAAKARCLLQGRFAVDLADIEVLARPVLRHRIVLNFEAEAQGIKADAVIETLLKSMAP